MKKLIILLLLPFLGFSQAIFDEGVQIGGNTSTVTTSKLISQETSGVLNYINATALPVSTATQTAIDAKVGDFINDGATTIAPSMNAVYDALQLKENISNKATDFTTVNNTLYPSVQAVKTYADGLVVGLLNDRGSYDASVNLYPSSGGSGTAGAIKKGNLWAVSVAGTLGGTVVGIGDWVRALSDTPGQTSSNWSVVEGNFGYVPANDLNVIHTTGDESKTGSLTITNSGLTDSFKSINNSSGDGFHGENNSSGDNFYSLLFSTGGGFVANAEPSATGYNFVGQSDGLDTFMVNKSGNVTGASYIKSGGTSSQFLKADGSVDTTSYASLASPIFTGTVVLPSTTSIGSVSNTELSYVDGVTSSIQTQINTKATDASVVHITGNETIGGTKTFSTTAFLDQGARIRTYAYFDTPLAITNIAYPSLANINSKFGIVGHSSGTKKAATLDISNLSTSTRNYLFPDTDGTFALTSDLSSYAPSSGSTSYIQNQNSSAQTANMWISGNGTFNGNLSAGGATPNINPLYVKTATDYNFRMTQDGGIAQLACVNDAISAHSAFKLGNSWLSFTNTGVATFSSTVTAASYIKSGGTSSQLLTADGTTKSITQGTATLSGGTVVVSTTAALTGSVIIVSLNTPGGTLGIAYASPSASIVNGTSFVINSVSAAGVLVATDTSTINWQIIN